jgi:hypothetical protein
VGVLIGSERHQRRFRPASWVPSLPLLADNWEICTVASSNQPTTGPLRVSDLAAPNIFRLSRLGDAVLVQESANDHEALHTYSLPGIVMYQTTHYFRHP